MEKQTYAVGDRVEKLCTVCGVERGHVVASITKRGQISRVTCPICARRSSFKSSDSSNSSVLKAGAPYDPKRTYRTGQTIVHPSFGPGEVTALIEPQKMDVLFSDRLRRLVHARV